MFSCSTFGGLTSIVMAWMGFHVWSLVIGGMIRTIGAFTILLMMIPVRPRLRLDLNRVKRFAAYGFKNTLNDFVSYLRSQACNFVLSRVGGPAMVGLYNKAESLMKAPLMIAGSVYDPVFRGLAKVQDDDDKCRYLYFPDRDSAFHIHVATLQSAWHGSPNRSFSSCRSEMDRGGQATLNSFLGRCFRMHRLSLGRRPGCPETGSGARS